MYSKLASLKTALSLMQGVITFGFKQPPRVWFVTKNAMWVDEDEKKYADISIANATLWGFAAALCLEHPEYSCRRVDLDTHEVLPLFYLGSLFYIQYYQKNAELLLQEISHSSPEDQVGFRNGVRYVARFSPLPPPEEGTYLKQIYYRFLV